MEIKNESLGIDFKNLMSCIHYHEDSQDNDVILETLKTIIDICSNESCGRDAFREEGGLDFLVEFLFETDNTIFLDHALKTVAFVIDKNVHNQMYMSKRSVFEVLQAILKNHLLPTTVQKNALVLISTILYHNSTAQSLLLEVELLQDLLTIYEQYAQGFISNSSCKTSILDNCVLNLWMSTNSALCFAVNNPQNEKNQDICKNIFPLSLRILEFASNPAIMNSVASFLALTISDNGKCQDYFSSCDGFLVLKRCFQKYFESLLMDMKICNGITGKENYQAINNIIGIITSPCLDHEKNAAVCGDLGILSMMVDLLFIETLDIQLKTKIVLCLGHCIASCCTNKSYVLETENFDIFLKKSLQLGNEELSSACKYLLQVCLAYKGSSDSNLLTIEDNGFDSASSKWKPDSKKQLTLNEMDVKILSLKKSSTKVSNIKSPSSKVKSNSGYLKKTYSTSSSICENASQTLHKKRKPSISRPLNKLSSIKSPSNSSSVQYCHSPENYFLSKDKEYSTNVFINTNLDSSIYNSYKKEMNQPLSYDKFSKPDVFSKKISFTDFLKKETKSNKPELKNPNFLQADYTKTVSDSIISEWNTHSKDKLNKRMKLPIKNSIKMESVSQDKINNSFLPYERKLANQTSVLKKFPTLFKKKKNKLSSRKSTNISSSSSSIYSFTPHNVKSVRIPDTASDTRFEYSISNEQEINIPGTSKNWKETNDNQDNCVKCNPGDKLQSPVRKPFSFDIENQLLEDQQSTYSFKLNSFGNSLIQDNSFPTCRSTLKTDKENSLDLTNITDASYQYEKKLLEADIASNLVSHYSKRPDECLDDSYQSINLPILPQMPRFTENLYQKKYSWSCSSTGTGEKNFPSFSSCLNSSRQVQVIVLPKETCEQHGLSRNVELLEVISLEDIINS